MKVIHMIDSGGLYGAEIMLLALVKEQKNIGVDVEVISIGKCGEREKPIEVELQRIGCVCHPVRMKPKPSITQSIKLIDICVANGAALIHSHGYKSNIMMAMLPSFLRRLPVVSTLHGYTKHKLLSKMTINQIVDKIALRFLNAVVLVSPAISIGTFGIRKKIRVIFNGIPNNASRNIPISDFSGNNNNGDVVIGTVGRLSKEKNFSFLIRAMPEILRHIPQTKLVIHGEGELRGELESLVDALGLQQQVSLPGYIQDVDGFLKNIDVYVNCSTTEGMPITLLEAMRAKCLLLASRIPANRFLLEDHFNDLLYDLDVEAFVATLIKLDAKSDNDKSAITNKLNDIFLENYTAKQMAEKYKDLYLELL